jgi:Zn-dependent M28 family amino/carboxypeptidase
MCLAKYSWPTRLRFLKNPSNDRLLFCPCYNREGMPLALAAIHPFLRSENMLFGQMSRSLPKGTALIALLLSLAAPLAAESGSEARMRKDVTFLASDQCEGRGVTTEGINRAADYIVAEFQKAGLKPAGPNGSYFQSFTIPGSVLGEPNTLTVKDPAGNTVDLKMNKDFEPLGLSTSGKVTAPLVFAGYGLSVESPHAYDDYQGIDAAGKVVIILRDLPQSSVRPNPIDARRRSASFASKLANAEKHQAAGVIFITDAGSTKDGDDLLPFAYTAGETSSAKVPAVHVHRQVIDRILHAKIGKSLDDIEQQIDRTLSPASVALDGWTASLETSVNRGKISARNIVGIIEGAGPLADETVILGAHYDHLGYGGFGSLANSKRPAIHHGADDNGSGTTALIELARRFGSRTSHFGRRLVFIAFSGEELGLLGSAYYCAHPLFPLGNTVAMVNMDMVGRLRRDEQGPWRSVLAVLCPPEGELPVAVPLAASANGNLDPLFSYRNRLTVYGTGTSKGFNDLLESINEQFRFKLNKIPGGFGPSDHASFYAKKVPVFFFFTDDHEDYHRPSDTAEKINIAGMKLVADMVEILVSRLDEVPERPSYVKTGRSGDTARYEGMPRLGFRPGNYGESEGGVLVGGVIEGGAAARAGIKDGDRIVSIAGKTVENMSGYMNAMAAQTKGKPLEVGILRDGKKLSLTVVPD